MSNGSSSVLAFGELLWDVLHREQNESVLGGAPANFAYRLTSLQVPTLLISRVGRDALGEAALREMQAAGVNTDLVQKDSSLPTGTVDVYYTGNSHSFTINRGVAYDAIELTAALCAAARQASVLCFGTLIQRNAISRETLSTVLELANRATKVLDINLRLGCYTSETVIDSIERAHIIKLNDEEASVISSMLGLSWQGIEDFSENILSRYPNLTSCLVTRGANGVFALSDGGERIDLPGHKVQVVDTIGAGDAFTAGFVSRHLALANFAECCQFGNALGALVAARKGGMSPVASEEIGQFLVGNRALEARTFEGEISPARDPGLMP